MESYVYRPGKSGKGTGVRGPMPKGKRQKFLTIEEVHKLLDTVENDRSNRHRERDFFILFCGFYFGLRVSECARLSKHAFRSIDTNEAFIPTLKQEAKVRTFCSGCQRMKYFSQDRAGQSVRCSCGNMLKLPKLRKSRNPQRSDEPVEYSPPAVEDQVYELLRGYIEKLPDHQQFLFESAHGPMHPSSLNRIFNKYACEAGLDRRYCWHSLRHGRGVHVYERSEGNLKAVQDMLRHKSLATAAIYVHLSPMAANKLKGQFSQDFRPRKMD